MGCLSSIQFCTKLQGSSLTLFIDVLGSTSNNISCNAAELEARVVKLRALFRIRSSI